MNKNKQTMHCTHYTGNPKCHFTGVICSDEYAQECSDYESDEGLYLCPHCGFNGLKAFNYGGDDNPEIVWECLRCGAELWYCESVNEMLGRCREIREDRVERERERIREQNSVTIVTGDASVVR